MHLDTGFDSQTEEQVDVAELVYALGLGSSGAIHEGSSPFIDTCQSNLNSL